MTALETIQDGVKTFAKDVADGFFAITHNGLAFVGLVVFCLATLFGMRPDLRMGAELRLISWLQDRQSELMSSDGPLTCWNKKCTITHGALCIVY